MIVMMMIDIDDDDDDIFVIGKVLDLVLKKNGIVISIGIGFGKNRFRKKYRYRFRKFLVSKKVSVSVSENFGIEKSIGIGFGKFWYLKKVSDSVSKNFGIGKKFRFRSDFGYRHTLLLTPFFNLTNAHWRGSKLNSISERLFSANTCVKSAFEVQTPILLFEC